MTLVRVFDTFGHAPRRKIHFNHILEADCRRRSSGSPTTNLRLHPSRALQVPLQFRQLLLRRAHCMTNNVTKLTRLEQLCGTRIVGAYSFSPHCLSTPPLDAFPPGLKCSLTPCIHVHGQPAFSPHPLQLRIRSDVEFQLVHFTVLAGDSCGYGDPRVCRSYPPPATAEPRASL